MKPTIAFVETGNHQEQIKESLSKFGEITIHPERLEEVIDRVKNVEILSTFIHSRVDKNILDTMPNLKLIATRSTGFDHIDTESAFKKNISIANIPFYGENTVAEHTFALIMALTRNIHRAYIRTQKKDFSLEGLIGFDLKGKTLGVIGAGHIGFYVIKMAKGFGMNVLAYDVNQNHFLAEVLGFDYVDMNYLLENSDIITLHAPYNKKTHHLINKNNIVKIKKGALLINTARGGLVDTSSLIWALDQGILSGAGLDVLEGEELIAEELEALTTASKEALATLIRDQFLLNRENVVITPHIAFYSKEAVERIWKTTFENIRDFIEGRPRNLIPEIKKAA